MKSTKKLPTDSFFQMINSLMESWRVEVGKVH